MLDVNLIHHNHSIFGIYYHDGSACIKQIFCSFDAEEAKTLEVLISHNFHQILCKYERN